MIGRQLNLTNLPEDWKTKYPGEVRGRISTDQSSVIDSYLNKIAIHIQDQSPSKIKQSIVRAFNTIGYVYVENERDLIAEMQKNQCIPYYVNTDLMELTSNWPVDIETLKSTLGKMYIDPSNVLYDIDESYLSPFGNIRTTEIMNREPITPGNEALVNMVRAQAEAKKAAPVLIVNETASGVGADEMSDVFEPADNRPEPVVPKSSKDECISLSSNKIITESDRLKKQYTDIEREYGKMSNQYTEFIEDWRNGYPSISFEHRKFPTSCDTIWHQGESDGYDFCIYVSTPIVPAIQNDITVTTDVTKCRPADLVHLFPVVRNYPRFEWMYKNIPGAIHHEVLGSILPIDDYTEEQLIDNIVRYPVVSGMYRREENQRIPSWRWVEVNGELVSTLKLWDTLPISKVLPHNKKIVAEYYYRKYLLDRDIKGMKYKYPIEGTMKPFIMLFTTKEEYASMGYTNPVELARQCVENRVSYIQTRNPIIRRIGMPCTNV